MVGGSNPPTTTNHKKGYKMGYKYPRKKLHVGGYITDDEYESSSSSSDASSYSDSTTNTSLSRDATQHTGRLDCICDQCTRSIQREPEVSSRLARAEEEIVRLKKNNIEKKNTEYNKSLDVKYKKKVSYSTTRKLMLFDDE